MIIMPKQHERSTPKPISKPAERHAAPRSKASAATDVCHDYQMEFEITYAEIDADGNVIGKTRSMTTCAAIESAAKQQFKDFANQAMAHKKTYFLSPSTKSLKILKLTMVSAAKLV